MKKVFYKMALAAVLALTTLFTGCKAPSSGGGSAYNPPEKNIPLTLEAIADGQITFDNLDRIINLKYKLNDGELTAAKDSGISVSQNDIITFFGEGTNNTDSSYFTINCSSDCYVYGNAMSLLTADYQTTATITQYYAFAFLFYNNSHIKNCPSKNFVLPATTLAYGCYKYMFSGCSSLTQAPELPATTLAYGCYYCMFSGCASLTQAPALPATTLANSCYSSMFHGCTKLTQAPVLPATTLANYCYRSMFNKCTSLTQAPELPVTTLAYGCYYEMFKGCTSLNKVTCLATDLSAADCTTNWLSGVASSGTFTKASGADWSSGTSGIPAGWTVQNK